VAFSGASFAWSLAFRPGRPFAVDAIDRTFGSSAFFSFSSAAVNGTVIVWQHFWIANSRVHSSSAIAFTP